MRLVAVFGLVVVAAGHDHHLALSTCAYRLSDTPQSAVYETPCSKSTKGDRYSGVTLVDPSSDFANGEASMLPGRVELCGKGDMLVLHRHFVADEYALVSRGDVVAYAVPPLANETVSAVRVGAPGGVAFFPRGWLHGFACAEGPCDVLVAFNSGVARTLDQVNVDTMLASAPELVAARALGVTFASFHAELRRSRRPRASPRTRLPPNPTPPAHPHPRGRHGVRRRRARALRALRQRPSRARLGARCVPPPERVGGPHGGPVVAPLAAPRLQEPRRRACFFVSRRPRDVSLPRGGGDGLTAQLGSSQRGDVS